MKKIFLALAVMASLMVASCGGASSKSEGEAAEAAEMKDQPLESGEYRAVSFEAEGDAHRSRFDGRMLVALSPEASGIYVYENGNRTKFSARLSLSAPFEKKDSIYVTTDNQNQPVSIIPGAEEDTLAFQKGGKLTKVAFERKAMSEMTAEDVWSRITEKLSK